MASELQTNQIRSFEKIWKGGYFGGDPLHPILAREYGDISLISVNYAVFQAFVRPHIGHESVVLEIGPGRGAWSKAMLKAKEIYVFDALSAEHNGFWEYVGEEKRSQIRYFEVHDANLEQAPEEHFSFIFSFGAFCHMPVGIQRDYQRNLFRKAKPGAYGLIMFSDFDKFNLAYDNISNLRTVSVTRSGIAGLLRFNIGKLLGRLRKAETWLDKNDTTPRPGRFFHSGIAETVSFMREIGWEIILEDVGLNHRDPIIYFRKPLI